MKTCDLHTHSYYSDGTFSPQQLVTGAEQAGLSAIALCDHNTVSGLPEFMAAGEKSAVETVPGIEFSTEYEGEELHLIMLFVKPEHYGPITDFLETYRRLKAESTRQLVDALQKDGFRVDYEKLLAQVPDGGINRAHVAAELTRQGHTASIKEAFKKYLAPGLGYFTPPKRPDFFETVEFIKTLGGIAVLAHPFLNLDEAALQQLLPKAAERGLDAMETMYARYDAATTETAKAFARRFSLLESGGSDFHGDNKPDISLGNGMGNLQIPFWVLENLRAGYL